MAESSTKASGGQSAIEQMIEPMRTAGEALRQAGERAREQNEAISGRLIDFAQSNLNDTLEALRAAAAAKDVGEVLAIQGNFLRNQMTRSMDQFRELAQIVRPADWMRK